MKNSSKQELRILSLLPAATEIVYLLGLEDQLVGVSHECDYPSEAKLKPKVTFSPITNSLSSLEIDQKTRELKHKGAGVFHIDSDLLKKLKPNLILTQEICDVCAIPFNDVKQAARILKSEVTILSLEPESIEDIFENILTIGQYTNKDQKAKEIVKKLAQRLINIEKKTKKITKPNVLMVEWLDPIMIAGHWAPEMVKYSGAVNLITKLGEKSYSIEYKQLIKEDPDIIIFAPCGFDIKRTLKEKKLIKDLLNPNLKAVQDKKIYLVDGNSYLTRPGPRIINGVEILAEINHSDIFPRKHLKKDWQKLNL